MHKVILKWQRLLAMNYKPRTLISTSNWAAYGDSHTWGIGNNEQDTWAYKLGAVNYGYPGVSTDYVLRRVKETVKDYEVAFFLWPDWTRFEIDGEQILPNTHPEHYRDRDEAWLRQNRENKIVEIEQLCEQLGVLDVSLYQDDLIHIIDHSDKWPIAESTRNNPKPHFNSQWHTWIADLFRVKLSFRQYEQTR